MNQLSGSLPTEIGSLFDVQHIGIRGNDLTGKLPSQIGLLGSLSSLIIHSNAISGSVPMEFENLELELLVVSDTYLVGTLPSGLCSLEDTQPESILNEDLPWLTNGLGFDCSQMLCGCSCICSNSSNVT